MSQSRFNAAHLKTFLGTVLVVLGLGLFAPASYAASAFTFSASSYSAGEGTAKANITINRVGGSKGSATVQWRTTAGTASTQDYVDFGLTTLSFANGETQKVQTIQLVDDTLAEQAESFTVSLANPSKWTTLGSIPSATVTILDNDAAAVDVTAPSVAIASPTSGSTFTSPQTMAVAVNATDNVSVARVELYDGAALLGSKSAAPYNFSFAVSSASNGNHSLSAKAFDAAGNSKVSAAANITVSIPVADATAPSVSLSSPANGTTYTTAQTVTIAASATDNVGVSKVEFYDGAALLGSDSAAPYSFAWPITSAINGSHSLTAKAFDAAGNAANSATSSVNVNIAVAPATYVAPVLNSVTISSGNYVLSWSLPPTAYGTPAGGYNVYVDGVDDNLNNFTLSSVKSGLAQDVEHCFSVEARWTQAVPGVFSASNQVCVAAVVAAPAPAPVADTTLPTVAITSPAAGATYTSAQTVTVAVSASDNVGVSKVELYDGTSLLGSDTAAPYSFAWAITSGSNGSRSLTAKAYDAAGNIKTSSPITLSVNIATSSSVTLRPDGKLPVFPGAEGFGAGAVAGRGGSIIKVTNLNDSGTGSFRAAVTASGPRIVVFEVGGTIQLLSTVYITNPYLTIAGQTAPEPGIQLKGYGLEIDSHDVLIQHLRVRITAPTVDGIRVFAQRTANYNIVIDHVTANWATDENMSIWGGASGPGVHDITISNCLIAESGYGLLVGSYVQQANHMNNISIIDNLFAHNGERDPVVSNNSNVLVANNLAYNPTYEFTALVGTDGSMKVTFIGNHYVTGANSLGSSAIGLASTSVGSFYLKDNLLTGVVPRSMTNSRLQSYLATQPTVVDPTVSISPATAVKSNVTTFAGARPDTRDSVEQRIVTEVMTESGVQKKSGTWPAEYNTPSYRTFSGGSNPNGDDDGDGYTNVEEILHQMAAFVEGR